MGVILVSAWLGGELSYRYRVGVDKTTYPEDLTDWTDALDEAELMEGEPRRVEVAGQPVLLYRDGQGEVFAIGAVCAHEGGPLEKGKIDGMCVECPWHQSVYDLRDGSVVHGPATYAVPNYHLRIQHGKIQVRVPQGS
jgi:nitrite reductase/ring-hydroxylating ferredoxin subunit